MKKLCGGRERGATGYDINVAAIVDDIENELD
jgi:hypothetical protein